MERDFGQVWNDTRAMLFRQGHKDPESLKVLFEVTWRTAIKKEEEMKNLLLGVIVGKQRLRGKMTRDEFCDFVHSQICLYGGDVTATILSYYGDRLENEIKKVINS